MTIIVIDSGVKLSHPCFQNDDIESYELKNGSVIRVYNDNDSLGHGTAVSYLISKSFHRQNIKAKIIVIKCFDRFSTTEPLIIDALTAVLNKFNADVVNLSFGITKVSIPEIETLCHKISFNSTIVSSADNTGYFTLPCILPEVYGVTSDSLCKNQFDYSYIENAPLQIGAFGNTQRVAWINPDYIYTNGNSYACANASGIIAGLIYQNGRDNLEKILIENARHVNVVPIKETKTQFFSFGIKKAALFPFNKEMSSLVLFEDLLNFKITDIYDSAFMGKVGARTSQILKLPVLNDRIIENINNFDVSSIDTLILGHFNEYLRHPKEVDKIKKMLSLCRNENINIYSFDSLVEGENVFTPKITIDNVPPQINGGMMYQILSPILGVYGTSSKQGKFTLQLMLRRELIKRGFNIGQLGSEPQALLFSFDSVYPMGYNSTVQISGYDAISYLNSELHRIEMKHPTDLIITGSQSSTIPFSFGHLNQYTFPCIDFLMGTCPDAVLLCVNCFDSVSYIRRTIGFIESSVDCKVIALVVFPVDRRQSSIFHSNTVINLDSICSSLQREFSIPTYILGENIDSICDTVVDYFQ